MFPAKFKWPTLQLRFVSFLYKYWDVSDSNNWMRRTNVKKLKNFFHAITINLFVNRKNFLTIKWVLRLNLLEITHQVRSIHSINFLFTSFQNGKRRSSIRWLVLPTKVVSCFFHVHCSNDWRYCFSFNINSIDLFNHKYQLVLFKETIIS